MNFYINESCKNEERQLLHILQSFDSEGEILVKGKRNTLKIFSLGGRIINIKKFKTPNFVNRLAYKYIRKSKAKRSYEYAQLLLKKGIGTPLPIGFLENSDVLGLKDSYYVSEQLDADFTFRALVEDSRFPDFENIVKAFTRFTFHLHENGIEFKDHSPGNTLIRKTPEGKYDFFLVDLNRMNFHSSMPFELRMKNMARLTPHQHMVAMISEEYAHLCGEKPEKVFDYLWEETSKFQYHFFRKKILKSRFL